MKRNVKISIICGTVLCFVGVAGAAPTIYFNTTKRGTVAAQQAFPVPKITTTPVATSTKSVISGHPGAISFPSVRINNVPVVDGYYNAKTEDWTLGLHTAQWGVMTPEPNDLGGNTYIYGHYRPEVFAYLHAIKAGAQAIITTDNGYTFFYTFESSVNVSPTDTSLFNYQGPPILTVQTCSGTWFQNRQLFVFKFDHVVKP
jgi:sortase (surface protein transpeptidase)